MYVLIMQINLTFTPAEDRLNINACRDMSVPTLAKITVCAYSFGLCGFRGWMGRHDSSKQFWVGIHEQLPVGTSAEIKTVHRD